jgi:thiol-disulfide isomerase/thioredoxin
MNYLKMLVLGGCLLGASAVHAQQVAVIRLSDLQKRLARPSDTTYVVNFWATWCAPCIKELPSFEQLNTTYAKQKVKVLLVSMDNASLLDKKVKPFIAKRALKSEVVLLNEPDPNSWINKLDPKWSGAIPFTLMVNNQKKKRQAFEQEFTQAELNTQVQAFLK